MFYHLSAFSTFIGWFWYLHLIIKFNKIHSRRAMMLYKYQTSSAYARTHTHCTHNNWRLVLGWKTFCIANLWRVTNVYILSYNIISRSAKVWPNFVFQLEATRIHATNSSCWKSQCVTSEADMSNWSVRTNFRQIWNNTTTDQFNENKLTQNTFKIGRFTRTQTR